MDDLTLYVSVSDGKYIIQANADGDLWALRNGEPWRDLTGDKLVFSLAYELAEAREKLKAFEST